MSWITRYAEAVCETGAWHARHAEMAATKLFAVGYFEIGIKIDEFYVKVQPAVPRSAYRCVFELAGYPTATYGENLTDKTIGGVRT